MKNVKAVGLLLLAGGLIGSQAKAAIPTPSIPQRVAAVRGELHKRMDAAPTLAGTEAASKLPYTLREVASWLNWVNWPNWNNWRNWNNWANWQNWLNF
jgi:hypothetical protein